MVCATRIAYETMKNLIIVLLGIIGCISCNDSSQSRRYMPNQGYTEELLIMLTTLRIHSRCSVQCVEELACLSLCLVM